MNENESERSFGELPTFGRDGEESPSAWEPGSVPSWMSEAETLRSAEGIRDDGRTDAARRWKPGDVILDRYVVEGELGQGGMGVVYACLDRVGGVRVAVKCLPPELSHNSVEMEEVRENFRLVCGLAHPNIAVVRHLERDARGEYFLVMDVAEGESLRKWVRAKWKSGGVGLAEAVGILRQVASALDYAHGEKVIHRDVKPGNVMIDGKGRVKVLDFGLAAQIRTSLSRASHAYRGTSGTGPYMAPEQWRGRPQDGKTDQYALGVMAYEMLAGRLPFENDDVSVLREVVLKEEPDAVPGLPEKAMAAIRRTMAKRAEERFGSCTEFVEALAGERRPAGGGSPLRSVGGWVAALVLAAGVAGAWWWGGGREDAGWTPAQRQEEAARPEGSPHQTAGEMEAEKRAEEERLAAEKAAEEKRLAEQKAAEEEARRLEEERVRAQREEEIRQKSEELEETVYRLAPLAKTKASNAAGMGYDRGQGFGDKLDEAKSKLEQGEAAVQGRNFAKAKEYFESSMGAADWCAENEPLRKAAAGAREAVAAAKKKADAMDGAHLALRNYKRASEKEAAGQEAFEGARFKEATAAWNTAVEGYGAAERDARAEKVRQGLEAAQGAERRSAWEECLAAAEGVLALDAGNAEAKRLKAAAERQMKPSILLKATLNGWEVAATVTEGLARRGLKTPVTVNLEKGGSYSFTVEYVSEGKKYAGQRTVKAKPKGVTEATVVLEERPVLREGSRAGERTTVRVGAQEVALRWCPAGPFTMGSPKGEAGRLDNETQHRVTLTRGFWMGETEVTQGLWREVMGENPSVFKNGDNYPVEAVSWEDCQQFVQALNVRHPQEGMRWALPTEAQWEYACRAGTGTAYFWGNALNGEKANCDGNYPCGTRVKGPYKEKTTPVGSYAANAWGLYDMHGNVWEWCADWFGAYPSGAVTDPQGPSTGSDRVSRGGSWCDHARACRSANRISIDPGFRLITLGLRVALLPDQ